LKLVLLCAFSASVSADSTSQPKYPPGFDCSAIAAGSQRQACNRSQLDPPMGPIPETTRRAAPSAIPQQPEPQRLPTEPPPTIPRLPGTIDSSN
jgi:hypothetical protein